MHISNKIPQNFYFIVITLLGILMPTTAKTLKKNFVSSILYKSGLFYVSRSVYLYMCFVEGFADR